MRFSPVGDEVAGRAVLLLRKPDMPDEAELGAALRAHRWFLDRAAGGGIPLTAAGYLKPDDVIAASAVLPAMSDWIGENNREANAYPLLQFRHSLQSAGLLRKYKGRLLLTKAGAAAQRDPARLWDHLTFRLLPGDDDGFDTPATLLLLLYAATSAGVALPLDRIAAALTALGWCRENRRPLSGSEIHALAAFQLPSNLTDTSIQAPVSCDRRCRPLVRNQARRLPLSIGNGVGVEIAQGDHGLRVDRREWVPLATEHFPDGPHLRQGLRGRQIVRVGVVVVEPRKAGSDVGIAVDRRRGRHLAGDRRPLRR